jgi:hypothetical protein
MPMPRRFPALHTMFLLFGLFALATPAFAQDPVPPRVREVDLSGPRMGFTSLSQGAVDRLQENNVTVSPLITQFGWQFEKRFFSKENGVTAVNEWVVLAGGLEQGVVLPSVSWIVGMRTKEGAEFGVGPNVTPLGVALVVAGGVTIRTGAFNIPMNVAMVPSKSGTRISVLTGFNFRR